MPLAHLALANVALAHLALETLAVANLAMANLALAHLALAAFVSGQRVSGFGVRGTYNGRQGEPRKKVTGATMGPLPGPCTLTRTNENNKNPYEPSEMRLGAGLSSNTKTN